MIATVVYDSQVGFSTAVWVITSRYIIYGFNVDVAGALRKKKEAYKELHGALLLQCFAFHTVS